MPDESVNAFAKGQGRGYMPKLRLKVAGEYDAQDAKHFTSGPLLFAVSANQGIDSRLIEINTSIVGSSYKGALAIDFTSLNVNDIRTAEFNVDVPVWYAPSANWPDAGWRVYFAEILINKTYIAIVVSPYEQSPVIHVTEFSADTYSKNHEVQAQFEANLNKQRQIERDFARQLDAQARATDANTDH